MTEDIIQSLVWNELVQTKSWEQYISEYTGSKMDWRKWFNIVAISLAVIGGATWGAWKAIDADWVTPLIFGVLGIAQLLSAIQKDIVVSSETLAQLIQLRIMYIAYSDKIERLYLKIYENKISDDIAEDQYFKLRAESHKIQELKDSLNIKPLKELNKRVEARVKDYLETVYS